MITLWRNKQVFRLLVLIISVFTVISILRSLPVVPRPSGKPMDLFQSLLDLHERNLPKELEEAHPVEINESEDEEEWTLDEANIPDLDFMLNTRKGGPRWLKPNCAKFPDLYTVRFSNVHWQYQETAQESFYFYAAYLDVRDEHNSYVRVLAMSDGLELNLENSTLHLTTCQYWFQNKVKPEFGNITDCKRLWNSKWGGGHYYPYILTCQLPSSIKQMPDSVSLVSEKCSHATNNLNIIHKERFGKGPIDPGNKFGVCVKALDFPDGYVTSRLVEWIEMLRILGADKIFLYEFFVDSAIKKVLDYYESKKIVDVTQTTLPGELPNQPQIRHLYIRGKKNDKRLTELIPYNDCLYKHMYDYKYVAIMDTDEIIMTVDKDMRWTELMNAVNEHDVGRTKEPVTTYCFRNYYFLDGMMEGKDNEVSHIPEQFHMLRHIYHSNNYTGYSYMKCFHSTFHTLGVHNHFAFYCRSQNCKRHYVAINRAQMNHYRSTCVAEIKNCSSYLLDSEKDTTIWRYQDELINRINSVMKIIS